MCPRRVEADENEDAEGLALARIREPEVGDGGCNEGSEEQERPATAPGEQGQEEHREHRAQRLLGEVEIAGRPRLALGHSDDSQSEHPVAVPTNERAQLHG